MISDVISRSLWLLLLVQGTACITAGLAASYLLRDRPARAHRALLTALLASMLMPGAYAMVKHLGLGALAARPMLQTEEQAMRESSRIRTFDSVGLQTPDGQETCPSDVPLATPAPGAPASLSTADPVVTAPAHGAASTHVPWGILVAACWIATSTLLLIRLILRFASGLRLLETAHPLESSRLHGAVEAARDKLGIPRPVRIRCSEQIESPVIWCWAREPVLLVHGEAAKPEDNMDWVSIFCHEFAHLRRRDHISGLLAEVLAALLPWHLLLWWARGRLARLSEQACDDWVLATGQTGVDYAESLLDLSPQRQMAILPTIVGKEKAMKERIRRIVRDEGGNPMIGARWAAIVSALAVLAVVGVAVAQRGPVEREQPQRELRRERREEPAEPKLPDRAKAQAEQRESLTKRLQDLRARAEEIQRNLQEHPDMEPAKTDALRQELRQVRRQASAAQRELQGPSRRGEQPERERTAAAPRRTRAAAANASDLERRRAEMGAAMRRLQQELRERQKRGEGEGPEAKELREKLEALRKEASAIEPRPRGERTPQGSTRRSSPAPEADRGRRIQAEIDELRNQMNGLREQMQQMQRMLEQLVQQKAGEQPQRR